MSYLNLINLLIKKCLHDIGMLLFICCIAFIQPVQAERLKDIATIQGVRNNQLIGYGLVVGLDGTGDQTTQTPFTVQSILSMMQQMGVNLPPPACAVVCACSCCTPMKPKQVKNNRDKMKNL